MLAAEGVVLWRLAPVCETVRRVLDLAPQARGRLVVPAFRALVDVRDRLYAAYQRLAPGYLIASQLTATATGGRP